MVVKTNITQMFAVFAKMNDNDCSQIVFPSRNVSFGGFDGTGRVTVLSTDNKMCS